MEKIQTALRTFKTCIEIANVTEPRRKWLMKRYEDAIEEVKLLATTAVSVELPLTEARLSALHDIAKQYCYTTQDNSPTISRKGVELLFVEYSKGN